MLPLKLHVNQKSDYDDIIYDVNVKKKTKEVLAGKDTLHVTDSKRQNTLQ